jgi:hypothetical protein
VSPKVNSKFSYFFGFPVLLLSQTALAGQFGKNGLQNLTCIEPQSKISVILQIFPTITEYFWFFHRTPRSLKTHFPVVLQELPGNSSSTSRSNSQHFPVFLNRKQEVQVLTRHSSTIFKDV